MATDTTENKFVRSVRTFVLRAGRMTDAQKKSYNELAPRWCIPFNGKPLDYSAVFGNSAPVTVEIGFGMGQATGVIARNNPGMNYIGIEVHQAGVGRLLGDIARMELENLRIIEHDALEVLETMIPDESLAAFHVFFPDPWPKKKHHKRRLMQRPRTELLTRKLAPGGYLYMATDWEPYGIHALEELEHTQGLRNRFNQFAPRQEWRPETRFEEKGKQANRAIFELMFEKMDRE